MVTTICPGFAIREPKIGFTLSVIPEDQKSKIYQKIDVEGDPIAIPYCHIRHTLQNSIWIEFKAEEERLF